MKEMTIGTTIRVYEDWSELEESDLALVEEAAAAVDKAYAPYSRFRVGAATRLEDSRVLSAANQENGAYPLCLCAEMVLMSAVTAQNPKSVMEVVAIMVSNGNQEMDLPVSPCGACRQTLLEYEGRQGKPMRLLLAAATGLVYEVASIKDLLPLSFDGGVLR